MRDDSGNTAADCDGTQQLGGLKSQRPAYCLDGTVVTDRYMTAIRRRIQCSRTTAYFTLLLAPRGTVKGSVSRPAPRRQRREAAVFSSLQSVQRTWFLNKNFSLFNKQ